MSAVLESAPIVRQPTKLTADDLLNLPDSGRYELVNGKLVERNMGWESEWIGSTLLVLLGAHCLKHHCGYVNGSSAGYQCFDELFHDDPERVRKPDVSFISIDRLPSDQLPEGHCEIVSDLAVEVISPNDRYREVEEKVDEYLAAGVRLVWVVDPHSKTIRVHRANHTVQDLTQAETLSGEDVIPGFQCLVNELFDRPTKSATS